MTLLIYIVLFWGDCYLGQMIVSTSLSLFKFLVSVLPSLLALIQVVITFLNYYYSNLLVNLLALNLAPHHLRTSSCK